MSKLWGSRFTKKSDQLADLFTFSIKFDHVLAKYDVIGSIAHAQMLSKQRIIPKADAQQIIVGLTKILSQIKNGKFKFDPKAEDIHTHIQNTLSKMVGPAADRLHTARSRNDQVATDLRLYIRCKLDLLTTLLTSLRQDRKSTRLNSSHSDRSRMPSSA